MKYLNKQILKAILKGINLAVDDLDDLDTTLEVLKKTRIKDDIHAKDLLPFVDLGLPSGTLWYKYNVGVDPSDLLKPEKWYGNYYTWDEAKSLKGFDLPSEELCKELIKETKIKWTSKYNGIKGLCGKIFTGSNGNSIFIPAAGYINAFGSKEISRNGSGGWIWTDNKLPVTDLSAYSFYFYSRSHYTVDNYISSKFSVRPIFNL